VKYPTEPRWLIETQREANGWRTFVLIVLHGRERANFHLSHGERRFARSFEFARLANAFPSILEDVAGWLERPA
jgi:hypothetical protein